MEPEKRAKDLKSLEHRFSKLITLVGEAEPEKRVVHIQKLATEIVGSPEEIHSFIATYFATTTSWLPNKQFIYSSCITHIAAESPPLAKRIIEDCLNTLKTVFSYGNFQRAKILLSFLCELTAYNCVTGALMCGIIESLAVKWRECRQDYYAYLLIWTAYCNKHIVPGELLEEISQ